MGNLYRAGKIATVDKVPGIVGDLISATTLAAAPIAEQNKVVLMSPTASAPKITEAGDSNLSKRQDLRLLKPLCCKREIRSLSHKKIFAATSNDKELTLLLITLSLMKCYGTITKL